MMPWSVAVPGNCPVSKKLFQANCLNPKPNIGAAVNISHAWRQKCSRIGEDIPSDCTRAPMVSTAIERGGTKPAIAHCAASRPPTMTKLKTSSRLNCAEGRNLPNTAENTTNATAYNQTAREPEIARTASRTAHTQAAAT